MTKNPFSRNPLAVLYHATIYLNVSRRGSGYKDPAVVRCREILEAAIAELGGLSQSFYAVHGYEGRYKCAHCNRLWLLHKGRCFWSKEERDWEEVFEAKLKAWGEYWETHKPPEGIVVISNVPEGLHEIGVVQLNPS